MEYGIYVGISWVIPVIEGVTCIWYTGPEMPGRPSGPGTEKCCARDSRSPEALGEFGKEREGESGLANSKSRLSRFRVGSGRVGQSQLPDPPGFQVPGFGVLTQGALRILGCWGCFLH